MFAVVWLLTNLLKGSQFCLELYSKTNLLLSLQVQVQQMNSDNERCRHGERKSIAFEETRRFSGRISQNVGPCRRRLRHDVDEHQCERSCLGGVAQYVVDPAVKTARQCVAPAQTAEGEPLCAVWNIPDELGFHTLASCYNYLMDFQTH